MQRKGEGTFADRAGMYILGRESHLTQQGCTERAGAERQQNPYKQRETSSFRDKKRYVTILRMIYVLNPKRQ